MEMEISRAMQVLEGLNQLHTLHNYVHANLTPESIVMSGGQWNICGFGLTRVRLCGDEQVVVLQGPQGRCDRAGFALLVEITEGGFLRLPYDTLPLPRTS